MLPGNLTKRPTCLFDCSTLTGVTSISSGTASRDQTMGLATDENSGAHIYTGGDSIYLKDVAQAANDTFGIYIKDQAFDLSSRKFAIRIGYDDHADYNADIDGARQRTAGDWQTHWDDHMIRIRLSNTSGDETDRVQALNLLRDTRKKPETVFVLTEADFSSTAGSGLDWDAPVNLVRIDMIKRSTSDVQVITVDSLWTDWESGPMPVVWSCDDQTRTQLLEAFGPDKTDRMFAKNIPMTMFVNPDNIGGDTVTGAVEVNKLNLFELQRLYQSGLVDVGGHTMAHDNQVTVLTDYAARLADAQALFAKLQSWGFADGQTDWAYTYGDYNQSVIDAVRAAGFLTGRTTDQGDGNQVDVRGNPMVLANEGPGHPDTMYHLRTLNLNVDKTDWDTLAELEAIRDRMITRGGEALFLYFHKAVTTPSADSGETSITFLASVIDSMATAEAAGTVVNCTVREFREIYEGGSYSRRARRPELLTGGKLLESAIVAYEGIGQPIHNLPHTVAATGTWDTATVVIETSTDNFATTTTEATWTSNDSVALTKTPGTYVRAVISSVGATTDIDVTCTPT